MNFLSKIYKSALLLLITTLIFSASSFKNKIQEAGTYKIFIVQDSVKTEIGYNTNVIKLKRKRFQIELHLINQLDGIFISASFQKLFYDTPVKKPFLNFKYIDELPVSDEKDNASKLLMASSEHVSYLYYHNGEGYRVDPEVKKEDSTIILTKTIRTIFDFEADKTRQLYAITQPLYLVSFYTKSNSLKANSTIPNLSTVDFKERKRTQIIFE